MQPAANAENTENPQPIEAPAVEAAAPSPLFARFLEKVAAPVRTGLRAGARRPGRSV